MFYVSENNYSFLNILLTCILMFLRVSFMEFFHNILMGLLLNYLDDQQVPINFYLKLAGKHAKELKLPIAHCVLVAFFKC